MGYARKDVEKTKKIAKKFVRYQEGAELYSIGLTKFQELAKEAKAADDLFGLYAADPDFWADPRGISGRFHSGVFPWI